MNHGNEVSVTGSYWLLKQDKETGEILEETRIGNTITSDGLGRVLDLAAELSSARFQSGQARFRLLNSGGTEVFASNTMVAGYPLVEQFNVPNTLAARVTWRWEDVSINTYTAHTAEFRRVADNLLFSTTNVSSWGTKTNRQNWIYEYRLDFRGSINTFGDGSTYFGGLHRMAELMVTADVGFSATNTRLRVLASGGAVVLTGSLPTSGPTRTANTVTWQFQVNDNVGLGQWWTQEINLLGDPVLRRVQWDYGSKVSGDVWTFNYSLTVAEA
jgi:hypothetical protein